MNLLLNKQGKRDKSPKWDSSPTSHNKKNQDAYVVVKNFLGFSDHWFFGVFDGHGTEGHKVSHYIKRQLPQKIIENFMNLKSENSKADLRLTPKENTYDEEHDKGNESSQANIIILEEIRKDITFDKMKEVIRKSFFDIDRNLGSEAKNSGSTWCTWTIFDNKLVWANTGDSRAILISK